MARISKMFSFVSIFAGVLIREKTEKCIFTYDEVNESETANGFHRIACLSCDSSL